MSDKNIETMLGEELFSYEELKPLDLGEIEYYNVEFPFESMEKYNGGKVIKYDDGALRVCYNGNSWSGFITTIPEFRELLLERLKKEKLVDIYNSWRDMNECLVENRSGGRIDTKNIKIRKTFSDYAKLEKIISIEDMDELEDEYPYYVDKIIEETETAIIKNR